LYNFDFLLSRLGSFLSEDPFYEISWSNNAHLNAFSEVLTTLKLKKIFITHSGYIEIKLPSENFAKASFPFSSRCIIGPAL